MTEFIFKGKTLPDIFRFKKEKIRINNMEIEFEPRESQTYFEVHYKTEYNKEEAKHKIEAALDAWAKEMSLKYNYEIKYRRMTFGISDGEMEVCCDVKNYLSIAKESNDPTPKYLELINSYDLIDHSLYLYRKSLTAENAFFYHYMICETISHLCQEEDIQEKDIKFNRAIKELSNRYRHIKHNLPFPSKECQDLLNCPLSRQIDAVRMHSKEIIENCILYLEKLDQVNR
jgi:hypothetical protein